MHGDHATLSGMFPMLLLALCIASAVAQTVAPSISPTLPAGEELPRYLMNLGPYGLLTWAAFKLGNAAVALKDINLNVIARVDFSPDDRALIQRGVSAVEKLAHWVTTDQPRRHRAEDTEPIPR